MSLAYYSFRNITEGDSEFCNKLLSAIVDDLISASSGE
jgi:hypothetical protein